MAIYERHDWIAQRVETAIDPKRPIIDPHHHLWDRPKSRYVAEQFLADTRRSHNVTHSVFVECSAGWFDEGEPELRPVGETNFVLRQARAAQAIGGTTIAGIVGHVDLTRGRSVDRALVAHEHAGAGLFRGVRHGTNWSSHDDVAVGHHRPTEQLMGDIAFRAGVACVGDMGHSFDAWVYHPQLGELADLARATPGTQIIVNHLGGPLGIGPYSAERHQVRESWRTGIAEVASCPNVVLKIGGLGMAHYFGMPWATYDKPPASDEVAAWWADMVHEAIDVFGPTRCMFESNFPVDRQTLPYTVVWNAFQILADRYSKPENHRLFFATAAEVYRLNID